MDWEYFLDRIHFHDNDALNQKIQAIRTIQVKPLVVDWQVNLSFELHSRSQVTMDFNRSSNHLLRNLVFLKHQNSALPPRSPCLRVETNAAPP